MLKGSKKIGNRLPALKEKEKGGEDENEALRTKRTIEAEKEKIKEKAISPQ